jgi:predicted nucleic acid-binding protein
LGIYLDTSALAKRYHPEIGTSKAEQLAIQAAAGCFVSRLGMLEMRSVLAQKVRTSQISPTDSSFVLRRFRGTFAAGASNWCRFPFDTMSVRSALLTITAYPAAFAHWTRFIWQLHSTFSAAASSIR